MSAWRYVLTDRGGVSLGELRATQRTFSVGVSKPATATCTIRADDQLWEQVAAGDTMLRVYHSGDELALFGPVVSDEESAEGQGATVKITASDLSWRLAHRLIGKDAAGVGTVYTAQDSGAIAFNILSTLNAEDNTGIQAGTSLTFVARTITYLWKRALDAISELGAIQGSFEWGLRYIDATGLPSVYLDLADALGADRTSDIVLEYGTGRGNCSGYSKTRAMDVQADQVYVLGSAATQVAQGSDPAAIASYGLIEDQLSFGDITDITLLDALAAAHVAIRARPRSVITLTPFPKTAPKYGVDWGAGDLVESRVMIRGKIRAAGAMRIWGADIAVDEVGNEQANLQLTPST